MSDSADSPISSDESPPDQNSPPSDSESSPPDSSPTPPTGQDSSPPKSSPSDDSPSPPSDSNSSPPDSSLPSPPSDSNNPQPPDSKPSPPSPSPPSDSDSDSDSSPPSDSDSDSDSSPPSDSDSDSDSPDSSPPNSPPPPAQEQSSPPPSESLPPPTASNDSPSPPPSRNSDPSPPKQMDSPPETPHVSNPSPQLPDSPPSPTSRNPAPPEDFAPSSPSMSNPPSSRTTSHPKIAPPSKESDNGFSISAQSSPPSNSSSSSSAGSVAGVTVAGVIIIAFVAFLFVVLRRRKRRERAYATHYIPPPDSFSIKTDGYYHGQQQQHTMGVAGHSHEYYSGMPLPSAMGSSYGSCRGNVFNSGVTDSGTLGGSKSCFSYEEMMEITNGFSQQNVIGEGGFGSVYKGWLSDGRVVAVKQLKAGSGQGEREFRAEVEIISRVHHRHLVSLVGYCIAEHHRLLVYEFVPNNNLEHHLHGKGVSVMEWSKRVKIAIGAARGLAYLHDDCHPKIIHRDIKSANILLDDVFEAQVADFGLAKLSNDTHTHVSTRVMGTFGYMAPEYASSGKLTDRSDVFSFGVVLLELVTGRKPVDPTQPLGDESLVEWLVTGRKPVDPSQPLGDENLVEWARPLLNRALETRDLTDVVDSRLEKRYVESEVFRMIEAAAACVRHSAPKRPRMVQVLRALDTEGDMPDLSNGIKVGQSTIFEARQSNAEMEKFRMMAFCSEDSSEYDLNSGEYRSKEVPINGESETRAMNPRGGRF